MNKRFAIVIGVATAAVMALGAQTATALPHYHTAVTISPREQCCWHGRVYSEVDKCKRGRKVVLFNQQPGADTRLGTDRSFGRFGADQFAQWLIETASRAPRRVYAKVMPQRRDGFVCRADKSRVLVGD